MAGFKGADEENKKYFAYEGMECLLNTVPHRLVSF